MNDDDLLRSYRPAGPPPDLRARVTRAADEQSSTLRDWLPALATAAMIALMYVVATEMRARAYAQIVEFSGVHETEVPSP